MDIKFNFYKIFCLVISLLLFIYKIFHAKDNEYASHQKQALHNKCILEHAILLAKDHSLSIQECLELMSDCYPISKKNVSRFDRLTK